ncbi:hypothetical protein ACVBEJ_11145 [Porticoccus sp. GXU_MW_L64]
MSDLKEKLRVAIMYQKFLCILAVYAVFSTTSAVYAETYWVSLEGDDAGPCSSSQPCRTIQQGITKLAAGDTLNVKAGTYRETNSAGKNFFQIPISMYIDKSGTREQPITIQAAPGDEDEVVIDLQQSYLGFYLAGHQDYIHIKNFVIRNALASAIVTSDAGPSASCNNPSDWSYGVVIEGNKIYNTHGYIAGGNNAAIRMYGAREWIVRNNLIDKVTTENGQSLGSHNEGILSYSTHQVIIENNEITNVNNAVYWKASALDCPASEYQAIVRRNYIHNVGSGFVSQADERGSGGWNIVSNNIFDKYNIGVSITGTVNSGKSNIEHNFFNTNGGLTISTPVDIVIYHFTVSHEMSLLGNIFYGNSNKHLDLRDYQQSISRSDYNVFAVNPQVELFRYQDGGKQFTTLSEWQAARDSTLPSSPGANSAVLEGNALARNIAVGDYSLPEGSPAIDFVEGSANVGPYQNGNEIIGVFDRGTAAVPNSSPRTPEGFFIRVN